MVKAITISAALLLSLFCVDGSAQTTNSYTNDSTNTRPSDLPVSPEARAEAKRLYKEGVKYGLAGLFSQAAQIFERAVKLDPQHADAHFGLGHAYFDLKQWKKAVGSFERAVELNPKDQQAIDLLTLSRTMAHGGNQTVRSPVAAPRSEPAPPGVGVQVSVLAKPAPVKPDPAPVKTETPPVKREAPAVKTDTSPAKTETQQLKSEPPPVKTDVPPVQTDPPSEEVNEANAAANENALTKVYRVGPNDVLDIRTNDSAASQSTLYTVTGSGALEHPVLGEPLPVGGLTVDEISAKFESELKRRALAENPKVSVGVRDYASHTILVSGLVKDSGTKILRREAIPLYVVVADAQPLPEAARVTVVRNETNETFEIDLTEPTQMNLLVRPGDVITLLPNVTQFVYIGGEVKLPGEKTYRRGLTLTQAIIAAGGVTPKSKEARLGRDDGKGFLVVTRYKLKDIESGKVPDPVVKPGDRIMIVD
jgi:polysaccharide export outer membrane protein